MAWRLAPHVRYCVASGRVVFLDLARDRYLALPLDQRDAFDAWIRGVASIPPSWGTLRLAGLIEESDAGPSPPLPAIARAVRALEPATLGVPRRPGTAVQVAFSQMRVRIVLRRRGLLGALDWLRPTPEQNCGTTTRRHAAAFVRNRRGVPVAGTCLPDSLAMLDYLKRRGATASIVFGVTGTPFRAHCWVQLGDEVLNDVLDRIALFTPICQR